MSDFEVDTEIVSVQVAPERIGQLAREFYQECLKAIESTINAMDAGDVTEDSRPINALALALKSIIAANYETMTPPQTILGISAGMGGGIAHVFTRETLQASLEAVLRFTAQCTLTEADIINAAENHPRPH